MSGKLNSWDKSKVNHLERGESIVPLQTMQNLMSHLPEGEELRLEFLISEPVPNLGVALFDF